MTKATVGRNDPCPCGSGKKYKHCCLEKDEHFAHGSDGNAPPPPMDHAKGSAESRWDEFSEKGNASFDNPMDALRAALENHIFESEDEFRAFAGNFVSGLNREAAVDFHGLSPDQMHRILYAPFDSPELVRFHEAPPSATDAPIMKYVQLLIDAIGEKGLTATEKGNLPRALCREAARTCIKTKPPRLPLPPDRVYREADLPDLERVHFAMLEAGLMRKTKGRFFFTQKCKKTLLESGVPGLYPLLLRSYASRVNWGYWDRLPRYSIIQDSFLFSLFILQQDGLSPRSHLHYEDAFQRAFPTAHLMEEPSFWMEPAKELRLSYTVRTIEHFAGIFGLVQLEHTGAHAFSLEFNVTAQPLLFEAVCFNL